MNIKPREVVDRQFRSCEAALLNIWLETQNNHTLNALQGENRTLDFHILDESDEIYCCIDGKFDLESDDGMTHLGESDFNSFFAEQNIVPCIKN